MARPKTTEQKHDAARDDNERPQDSPNTDARDEQHSGDEPEATAKSHKQPRTFPLRPHEALSDKTDKITLTVSEDVLTVYANNGQDAREVGAQLLESQARKLGWL